jgi:hypothetical protein
MNTKRLQTAAALPAAAPEISARGANLEIEETQGPVGSHPVPEGFEIDLADLNYLRWQRVENIDLFVRLEELDPADPGEISGCSLWICGAGLDTMIRANSCEGRHVIGPVGHCVGILQAASIRRLVDESGAGASIMMGLREFYSKPHSTAFSGATLALSGGDRPEARVCFGTHCLGVLRPWLVERFLECARIRIDLEDK